MTGASSGIGLELAKQFAKNGFDLIVVAEDDLIHKVAEELGKYGILAQAVQADLATYQGNETLCDFIRANAQPVDALALNAGVGVHGDFLRETELEDHFNLLNLNVISTVHLARRIGRDMVDVGEGRILFTSSVVSLMPGTYMATYAASKAFVESFAEALRAELKDSGVTVTTLLPGATDTNFFRRAHMENTAVGASAKDDPADVARDGFEGLMAGKDHVVGGSFMNKVQVTVSKVLPDTVKAEMHRRQAGPAKH